MDERGAWEDYECYRRVWKAVLLDGIREAVKARTVEQRAAVAWVQSGGEEPGTCRWVCRVTGEEYGKVVAWVVARGKVGQRRQYRTRAEEAARGEDVAWDGDAARDGDAA